MLQSIMRFPVNLFFFLKLIILMAAKAISNFPLRCHFLQIFQIIVESSLIAHSIGTIHILEIMGYSNKKRNFRILFLLLKCIPSVAFQVLTLGVNVRSVLGKLDY